MMRGGCNDCAGSRPFLHINYGPVAANATHSVRHIHQTRLFEFDRRNLITKPKSMVKGRLQKIFTGLFGNFSLSILNTHPPGGRVRIGKWSRGWFGWWRARASAANRSDTHLTHTMEHQPTQTLTPNRNSGRIFSKFPRMLSHHPLQDKRTHRIVKSSDSELQDTIGWAVLCLVG